LLLVAPPLAGATRTRIAGLDSALELGERSLGPHQLDLQRRDLPVQLFGGRARFAVAPGSACIRDGSLDAPNLGTQGKDTGISVVPGRFVSRHRWALGQGRFFGRVSSELV